MSALLAALGPADALTGIVLPGGWTVEQKLGRDPGDSQTARAVCYVARATDGSHAFVKAFDFRNIETSGDTEALERMVAEYNNEKRIHQHCKDKRLTRVTQILSSGVLTVASLPVHYIVCEYAESSLRRTHPPGDDTVTAYDRLVALRKVASAIVQLHQAGVAHQDVKHSNVAYFNELVVKLTDLGSASCRFLPAPPHDSDALVGQPNLAPYELLYDLPPTSWQNRFSCDAFLLGNLVFTAFVGVSLTPIVLHAIAPNLRPAVFTDKYEQVLPDLVAQHFALTPEFMTCSTPPAVAEQLANLVLSLCHPNPLKRGLGRESKTGTVSLDLERAVGRLNTLATRAKLARC